MDRYYTLMLVPERDKKIRSLRLPRIFFASLAIMSALSLIALGIFIYDYQKILNQVYENKHLSVENRLLRNQLNVFEMRLNGISQELERIHFFEKKLRIITGIDNSNSSALPGEDLFKTPFKVAPHLSDELRKSEEGKTKDQAYKSSALDDDLINKKQDGLKARSISSINLNQSFPLKKKTETKGSFLDLKDLKDNEEYLKLKKLFELKTADAFGISKSYTYAKNWSWLIKGSLYISEQFARIDFGLRKIQKNLQNLELKVHQMDDFLLDKASFIKSIPTLLPVKGWVTSFYGPRKSPYSHRIKMHEGIDIGAPRGSHIIAPADGVVIYAGQKPGFGKYVQLDHGYGVETLYGHSKKLLVRKGQQIKRGTPLALVGSTGFSTGPHVHYEVRINGIAVDPLYYILD